MEKVFVIEFYVDSETKKAQAKLGCNKKDFKEDDLRFIEGIVSDLSIMIGLSYIGKKEEIDA